MRFLIGVFVLLFFLLGPFLISADTTTLTVRIIGDKQCNDGVDNDGDGKIDYPDDPGCGSSTDDDETDPAPSPGGGGGGGGGGGSVSTPTSAVFMGRAYPRSTVTLLKDAQVSATTVAGADATFKITLSNLTGGNYVFSLYSEDTQGRRSSLHSFSVGITSGAATEIGGIFIAPTISVDKSEVKRGNNIAIFGQSAPQADIIISVNSEEEFFAKTVSNRDGIYLHNFDTSVLDHGVHYTKSKASIGNLAVSSFGQIINFKVGTKNVLAQLPTAALKGDLNGDKRVNLVDFSIAAFWYKRTLSGDIIDKEKAILNGDGIINLVDFSIMAFHWTG